MAGPAVYAQQKMSLAAFHHHWRFFLIMLSQGRFLLLYLFIVLLFSFSWTLHILCMCILTWDFWKCKHVCLCISIRFFCICLWLFILFGCFCYILISLFGFVLFYSIIISYMPVGFQRKDRSLWIHMGVEMKKNWKGWRGNCNQYIVWKQSMLIEEI